MEQTHNHFHLYVLTINDGVYLRGENHYICMMNTCIHISTLKYSEHVGYTKHASIAQASLISQDSHYVT